MTQRTLLVRRTAAPCTCTRLPSLVAGKTRTWWDSRLLALWAVANGAAYLVVVLGGVALEELFAGPTKHVAESHFRLATFGVALIGSALHGFVLGRLQWWILWQRLPHLGRRSWVLATFIPAFAVWLLLLAPEAVHTATGGGETIRAFRDAFVQVLVLGPLIGLAQATVLRGNTPRWAWWFVANITTYLFGAVMYKVGGVLFRDVIAATGLTSAFPVLSFVVHGIWMLWVTDPAVTAQHQATKKR